MYEKYRVRSRWCKMLSRCEDDDHPQYKDYGGRGIEVCEEWHDFNQFYDWCMNNGFDEAMQLDRVDNDKGYSPDNCKFVSRSDNARNKRSNKVITYKGQTKTLVEWSEDPICRVSYYTLMQRVLRGWEFENALLSQADETRKGKVPHNAQLITAFGETKTTGEWMLDDRCTYKSKRGVWERINKFNWPTEKALTQPAGRGRPRKVNP